VISQANKIAVLKTSAVFACDKEVQRADEERNSFKFTPRIDQIGHRIEDRRPHLLALEGCGYGQSPSYCLVLTALEPSVMAAPSKIILSEKFKLTRRYHLCVTPDRLESYFVLAGAGNTGPF
jgi:hypothetical protein